MATKIITKNSSTATSIPTAGDLVQGELAVNVTDKRLFTEDSGGAIVELGTNPSTLTAGAATFSGAVSLNGAAQSDSITNTLYMQNLAGTRAANIQLDASGGVSIFDYNGSAWNKSLTLEGGAATFSGELSTATLGTSNFRAGVNAGNSIIAGGTRNTLIGDQAGTAITTGDYNVALGYAALDAEDAGSRATALGYYALSSQNTDTDSYNVAVGFSAGESVTTGTNNTLIGGLAGDAITTGGANTSVGYLSLSELTTGSYNVAVGMQALKTLTTASDNTAVGVSALVNTTTGADNTGLGRAAGANITTGAQNTAIGSRALDANTTASANTAVGYNALGANTTGGQNTAVGVSALLYNTTGAQNTASGLNSMYFNTTGDFNTSYGVAALQNNTTANNNTAVGHSALAANTTGTNNTAVGSSAGLSVTTGGSNTLIGTGAGDAITSGTTNTLVGYNTGTYQNDIITGTANVIFGAYSTGTSTSANDQHGFGYNLDCASNFTTLGAGSSDSRLAHGGTTWAAVSDERYKKDITDSTVGLSFINALRPRTFNYKNKGELPNTFRAYKENSSEVFKSAQTQHGFIAQEIKQAIDADSGIADGFKLWDEREDGSQEVAEAALIPMLVKAIQELTARLETLEGK